MEVNHICAKFATNITRIFEISMEKDNNFDALGIRSYYLSLPFGAKDTFIQKVAEALEISTYTVRRKIAKSMWKNYELKFVNGIINEG